MVNFNFPKVWWGGNKYWWGGQLPPHAPMVATALHAMEVFSRLSAEQQNQLANLIAIPPISERVPTSPNRSRVDWLLAFCVEALNDVRVDEVSQNDYNISVDVSEQYTPLIMELLSQFQVHNAYANPTFSDESTHISILTKF